MLQLFFNGPPALHRRAGSRKDLKILKWFCAWHFSLFFGSTVKREPFTQSSGTTARSASNLTCFGITFSYVSFCVWRLLWSTLLRTFLLYGGPNSQGPANYDLYNQLKEAKHNPPWFPPPLCNVVPPKLLCYSWALCGRYCSWWLLRRFFIAAAGAAAVLTLCNTKMHAQIFNDIDMYALYRSEHNCSWSWIISYMLNMCMLPIHLK